MTLTRENAEIADAIAYANNPPVDEEVELAVKHGMYWLDENVYNWIEVINLDMLNLESGTDCVLGQQWGANHEYSSDGINHYIKFIDEARPHDTFQEKSDWARSQGFLTETDSINSGNRLTRVWKEKIKERLNER